MARGDHYEVDGDIKIYDENGDRTGMFADSDTPGAVKVKDTYHIQYNELLCFVVSGMSDMLDSLETRVEALESC